MLVNSPVACSQPARSAGAIGVQRRPVVPSCRRAVVFQTRRLRCSVTVNIDRTRITRLVVRTPNPLGDAVLALPAIAAVRRAFAHASLAIAAPGSVAPMFEEETSARQDEIVTLADKGDAAALRNGRFDAILLLPNSFRSAWVARQAGIAERWGYSRAFRAPLLTRAVSRPRGGSRHQAEYYRALVRGLGFDVQGDLPRVRPGPVTVQRAEGALAREGLVHGTPLVGFAPGAAYGHAKRWPPRRVAELIAKLAKERGAACLLVGAAGDREAGREIESALPPDVRIVNLIGRTDLRLLIGILARCDAFVSNDSGAMHLAAAAGRPVTAIFGPTDDRATAPLGDHDIMIHEVFCRPCMLRDCPIDHRCMKGITVDAVFTAVGRRLDATKQASR
jgi:heptosyltransferase-2